MTGSEDSAEVISRVRSYDWRPVLPMLGLLALYWLYMPRYGSPTFGSLALHQQITAASALPTIFGSLYWFISSNDLNERKTPEERILDEE